MIGVLMKLGFDDNLGLPEGFDVAIGVEAVPAHELDTLLNGLEQEEFSAVFVPVGTLPYIKGDYEILVQSVFAPTHLKTLTTVFVVPQSNTETSIESASSLRLGRVNKFCTTSFWGPMVFLLDKTSPGTFLNFHDTKSFKDMLLAVNDGRVEGAMEWDIILQQNPDMASKTRELFRLGNLPAPVILVNNSLSVAEKQSLKMKMISYKTHHSKAFYTSFEEVNYSGISDFQEKMKACTQHFSYPE